MGNVFYNGNNADCLYCSDTFAILDNLQEEITLKEETMEAKDTVMSWERIRMIRQECRDKGIEGLFVVDKYCEAQAEISFPLGKQEGIREVVEWLLPRIASNYFGIKQTNIDDIEWKTQLDKWGIK